MLNYRISILGKLELWNADGSRFENVPARRFRGLLIELVTADLTPPRGSQAELGCASFPNLKRALWGGEADGYSDEDLRIRVSQLRGCLPEDIDIKLYESKYQLVGIARSDIDILDFVDRSLTTDAAEARELLELWRGDPSQIYPSVNDGRGFIPSGIWNPVLKARNRLRELVDTVGEATPSKAPSGMTPAVSVTAEPWFDDQRVDDTRLTWEHVELAVQRVLEKLAEWTPDMIIGINRGGAIFGGMLAKLISLRYIGVIAYVVSQTGGLERVQAPELSTVPEGGQILMVDEAHRSGHHMHHAVCEVRKLRPDVEVKTAVIAKADSRPEEGIPLPDYLGFRVNGNACMPWDPE